MKLDEEALPLGAVVILNNGIAALIVAAAVALAAEWRREQGEMKVLKWQPSRTPRKSSWRGAWPQSGVRESLSCPTPGPIFEEEKEEVEMKYKNVLNAKAWCLQAQAALWPGLEFPVSGDMITLEQAGDSRG